MLIKLSAQQLMNKLSKLEAIRGAAAFYVVLHHLFSHEIRIFGYDISIIFRFGQEAVILFFILSGFVIQYSYSKFPDVSFKSYFLKRFSRIYIPLILVFIVHYFLLSMLNNELFPIDTSSLIGNLLMLQDSFHKPNVLFTPFLGNSPLWSLSYEWWFYMLFFILSKKIKKNLSTTVYLLSTLSTITYIIYPNFFNRELMYFIIWWIGADIAKLFISNKEISLNSLRTPITFVFINILLLAFNMYISYDSGLKFGLNPVLELRHFTFALIAIVLAVIWKNYKWIGFNKTLGLFECIAPISFGIYITHWFLVVNTEYLNFITNNSITKGFLGLILCFCISYLIERVLFPKIKTIILYLLQ